MENPNYKQRIVETAKSWIENNALIVDTETTGLGDDDQIVEIAIIDALETFQFSALIHISTPIPPAVISIHGITDEMTARAISAEDLWPFVHMAICGRTNLAYNAAYDSRMIEQTFGPEARDHEWGCLMEMWMEFHGLERWQKLDQVCRQIDAMPGGHRALGDAKAAREVLRWLARQEV